MYIERVPNRNSPPAILLRESYREDGKVKKRTLANLSHWPPEKVEQFQALLRGEIVVLAQLEQAFEIVRSRPHGHVVAVLKTLRNLKLEQILCTRRSRDRGLLPDKRISETLKPTAGIDWITALRSEQIRQLFEQGVLHRILFETSDWVELNSETYPDERLIACYNSTLAQRRRQQREELLQATEQELDKIIAAVLRESRPLRGANNIGVRVGKVINRFKVAKHFHTEITDTNFSYHRLPDKIAAEEKLDGIYVIRTSVAASILKAPDVVLAYKSLSQVEQAFRSYKTVDLQVRPIFHRLADRVKAHIFLCMLAYYVEWHMRQALASLLFDEDTPEQATAKRTSVVEKAPRSDNAIRKIKRKQTVEDLPVHSFQSLVADLATVVNNRIQPRLETASAFDKVTQPTPLQQKAFELLGVHL